MEIINASAGQYAYIKKHKLKVKKRASRLEIWSIINRHKNKNDAVKTTEKYCNPIARQVSVSYELKKFAESKGIVVNDDMNAIDVRELIGSL